MNWRPLLVIYIAPCWAVLLYGAPLTGDASNLFTAKIAPALKEQCLNCHGAAKMGGLDLQTREGALKGGRRGAAVVPGNPGKSILLQAIEKTGALKMPPFEEKQVSPELIADIRAWIEAGAPWPKQQPPIQAKLDLTREQMWAFRHPRPFSSFSETTIDAFLDRSLRAQGITPALPSGKISLIRRATFDLIGLPPTPAEVRAFVDDNSADAFGRVVERLLASPRYGERWARHWLDVVRYADSDGYSNDYERPNAWRYRDYVIRSFQQDKPYNRFAMEQIAGDEMYPNDADAQIATGFLRMGPWEHTAMSVAAVTRQMFLDDVTHNTATVFLGLTLGCARCHDHKFDPIPTRDYYRMQAVFSTTSFAQPAVPFTSQERQDAFPENIAMLREMLSENQAAIAAQNDTIRAALVKKLGVADASIPKEVIADALKKKDGLDSADLERNRVYMKRIELYTRALERYQPLAYSVRDQPASPQQPLPETFILPGGNLASPGEKVQPGLLEIVNAEAGFTPAVPEGAAGRRKALAEWVTSPDNPLAARVMVNRIWANHFGKGLVGTPNNFGKLGKRPTHPELLEWLAGYFVTHGWSVKQMHRAIMLSSAYQRSTDPGDPEKLAKIDPENQLLSYFPSRRLEAEEIRDSLLAVSGEMSFNAGGPGTFPELNSDLANQPRLIMGTLAPAYQPSLTRQDRHRRTIYTFQKRSIVDPVVEVFNGPDLNQSCERRDSSTVPTQAFTLFNSPFSHDMALAFAVRLSKMGRSPAELVQTAFQFAYNRAASPVEEKRVLEYLARMTDYQKQHPPAAAQPAKPLARTLIGEFTGKKFDIQEQTVPGKYEENIQPFEVSPEVRALSDLALVLFNSNEFVYLN